MPKNRQQHKKQVAVESLRSPIPIAVRLRALGIAALIVIATVAAYWPTLGNGFIWDDDTYLTENPLIHSPQGLYQFWFTTRPIDYYPVSNSSLWLEWRLWGMNATGYHCTNLILHIITALLLWAALRTLSVPGAFLAGLLFALHPVNVESVAWIAQRKDMLALLFSLLSILCFLKAKPRMNHWYWLSLLAFTLGMLSKVSVVGLPLILVLIAWWKRGRLTEADAVRTGPFFGIAMVLAMLILWFWRETAPVLGRNAEPVQRILGAGTVVWFYLYKALWPANLLFVYPEWQISPARPLWWLPLLGVVFVSGALWTFRKSWIRPILFAWLFFLLALFPVMGFMDAYFMRYSLVADHYQHMAIIAPITLAAATWSWWHSRHQLPATVVAALVVGVFTYLTFEQTRIYKDSETLYRATLKRNPNSWLACNNLAQILLDAKQATEAIALFERAIKLASFYDSLAMIHTNLGGALDGTGRTEEAFSHYQDAIRLKPDYPTAHYNLGNLFSKTGRKQEAIASFQRAIELNPGYAEAHNNLATAFFDLDQIPEAIKHCQEAIRLKPDFAMAYHNLANALIKAGRTQDAIAAYQRALQLKADFPEPHSLMAAALNATGRTKEAIAHYQQALQLKPDDPLACNNLAMIYATDPDPRNRNPAEAVRLAQRAAEVTANKDPSILDTLAVAYAEVGRLSDAIATAQNAADLAQSMRNQPLAKDIEGRLKRYREQQASQQQPRQPP